MKKLLKLIPVLSEKAVADQGRGVYHFWGHPGDRKSQVKETVERLFSVKVVKVNAANYRGKVKMNYRQRRPFRRPRRRRFLVFLKPGETIKELALKESSKAKKNG